MIWLLTLLTFIATMGVVVALVYAFSPGEMSIASRLARIAGLAGPAPEEIKFADRQKFPLPGIILVDLKMPAPRTASMLLNPSPVPA